MAEQNTLLALAYPIAFDRIEASQVEPAVTALIERCERRIEEAASVPGERTWENTMAALDSLSEDLDTAMAVIRHLEQVATTPVLREAYGRVEPLSTAFYSRIPLHEGLWRALQDFAASPEAQALTGVKKRFIEKSLSAFRRHGAALPPAGKADLEKIEVELAELTTTFSQHVLDSTNAFELIIEDEARLSGLPASAREMARESAAARAKPGWRFTLQQPSYHAVITYLDDASVREHVYRAYHSRATEEPLANPGLVNRILDLRRAKARLLGYSDFAGYALEERMAKSGDRALAFLEDLKAKTEAAFRRENEELEEFRRRTGGPQAPPLAAWDIAYYSEKLRKEKYDFDEETLRAYFPLDQVLAGMFELVSRLYGIQVRQKPGIAAWDEAVRFYEILDQDGSLAGAFYADWYPRENKRGGAWMDAFLTGRPGANAWEPHLGFICGNLTPPSAGKPALLTHREVETVFHEFGHLLHHCLSRVPVKTLAGTSVAWDFVELPSQIMENWCWERESLDLVARHWETGAPLPEELFRKMKRARTFRAANAQMRQLSFGFLDLALHRVYQKERDGDVVAYARDILRKFAPAPLPDGHALIASFSHLFADPVGYAAGYYSYKWAEVLEADAFTLFKSMGVFSREAGTRFRTQILAKGDSEEPGALFRAFMGRDPEPAALLERAGLTA